MESNPNRAQQEFFIDLLNNILSMASKPSDCGEYIAHQIKELIGVRIVGLLEAPTVPADGQHTCVSVVPERHRKVLQTPEIEKLCSLFHHEKTLIHLKANSKGTEGEKLLVSVGLGDSIIIPLWAGEIYVGVLLLLDLLSFEGTNTVIHALDNLSRVIGLIFHNSILFKNLDHLVDQRTAELTEKAEQLSVNQRLLSKSQEMAKLGSWQFDVEKDVLTWSDEQYRIFGLVPQEFGANYEAFLETVHPEDRDMVEYSYALAIQKRESSESVHRIVRPDGVVRVVHEKSENVFDEMGRHIYSKGFTQDISDQYLQNQRYENIIKTSIDGFWLVDIKGKFLDVNNAYCQMSGYTHDELLQMSIVDIEAIETEDETKHRIKEIEIKGSARFESQHRRKDGSLFDVEVSVTLSETDHTFVSFIRDITERKKAEKSKEEMESRLAQAQKMEAIGTLAGGIAHDFNNLLSVILGFADLAKDDALPGTEISLAMTEVLNASRRAKDLVKQILTFSRQTQVERRPLKLHSLIKEGLKMMRSSIPTTITIREHIDQETGSVLADATQIHQILINLCTNAYHAMERTGGILTVSLNSIQMGPEDKQRLNLNPGRYLELIVSDTGPGIAPEVMDKIFEPYFTTKGVGKGTGLGLSIIHGIMQNYGGTISVESEVGKGSVFKAYFPVIEAGVKQANGESKVIQKGEERVLLVDDEETLAKMTRVMLERQGYNVTVRHKSIEALETFQNSPYDFDLVITDQTMPNMTGFDLAGKMLEIRPDIPIILCTGYSNIVDENSAKAIGIKGFAYKPLSKKDLSSLIRKVLE